MVVKRYKSMIFVIFLISFIFFNVFCNNNSKNSKKINILYDSLLSEVEMNIKRIEEKFGKPITFNIEKQYSFLNGDYIGKIYILAYKELEIQIFEEIDNTQEMLLILIKGNNYFIPLGITIGTTTKDDIEKLFGKPNSIDETGNVYFYDTENKEFSNFVEFQFKENKLISVAKGQQLFN